MNGNFNINYMMTQGCEYHVKDVQLDEKDPYKRVELHCIDIAGQNIFKEITFELLGKANMVILVYDVTNQDTFHLLKQWYDGIRQQNRHELSGVLVANKIDLENRIMVGPQDGQAFADSIGFEFFQVSTQQNKGIEEPFKALAKMFVQRYEQRVAELKHGK